MNKFLLVISIVFALFIFSSQHVQAQAKPKKQWSHRAKGAAIGAGAGAATGAVVSRDRSKGAIIGAAAGAGAGYLIGKHKDKKQKQ